VRLLPLLVLVAAGCAQTIVTVDRQPGFNGGWGLDGTSLDVQDSTATISYGGRLFVFEGVDWLRGQIDKDGIMLSGADGFRVAVNKDRIMIRDGKLAADRPLASLPAGRYGWQDGALRPR
jgi:hypothetical protein